MEHLLSLLCWPWCLQSGFFHMFNICVYIHMYISYTYSQFSLWCSVVSVFFFSLITLVVLEMLMGCCWRPQLWPAAGSSWLALALSDMGKLLAASHRHPCILCHYQNLAMQTQHIGSGSSDAVRNPSAFIKGRPLQCCKFRIFLCCLNLFKKLARLIFFFSPHENLQWVEKGEWVWFFFFSWES